MDGKEIIGSDFGDWKYESGDEYEFPVRHVWRNDELYEDGKYVTGVIKLSLSEGMHIMYGERGQYTVSVYLGSGPVDKQYAFDSEDRALEQVKSLLMRFSTSV